MYNLIVIGQTINFYLLHLHYGQSYQRVPTSRLYVRILIDSCGVRILDPNDNL